ncbi:hypothetical protein BKA63DRAFT_516783 [Paraphoma chrysanthemicola]|nr:hypothetical protein BKA63DRAFT_516783 [Paraphoma chrysanthemicola]
MLKQKGFYSIPAKKPTPTPIPITIIPTPQAPPPSDRVPAPVMFMPAIIVPVPDIPLMPLIAMPDGIDMTEPSDMVMSTSMVAEADMLIVVEVDNARAATGSLAHSIVTAGRDGVAIGTIFGGGVMLVCASVDEATARMTSVEEAEKCISK